MKVIAITDLYAPRIGGLEDSLERIMSHIQKMGHEVLVVAARNPPTLPKEETIRGIRVKRLFFIRPQLNPKWLLGLTAIPALIKIIKEENPDVINVHFPHSNALASCVAISLFRDIPFVVTFHGNDAVFMKRSWISWFFGTYLIRNASAVTAVSEFIAKKLLDEEGFTDGALPIRSAIDVTEFDSAPFTNHKLPERFIYSTGRFVYKKGFDLLLKAFALADIPPDVKLIITGDGPERQRCISLAEKLGIKDKVEMPGFVKREMLRQLFRECTIFVLPSREEPLGLVVWEAMASRKAVVATDVGGVSEMVRNGITGLLCKPTPHELARCITWMIANPHKARLMGIEGRRVAESYSWDECAKQYLDVYMQVTKKKSDKFGRE
ncbi:MAG: glycosyltransferase family 4 protein [Candidatus Anstonellales archaeon]